MEQYINKDVLVEEIEDWRDKIKKGIFSIPLTGSDRAYATFEYEILGKVRDFLDTLEVKEINNVWHDTRRTIPEDGSEQIICIKEDGLAVSTVGKIINGTIKWAYLSDLLHTNSFNIEVKEADLEKEIKLWFDYGLPNNDELLDYIKETAKHFYELGLKTKGE